jgi:hypothetical protein
VVRPENVKLFTNLYPNNGPQPLSRFELVYQQNKWYTFNLAGTKRRTASGKYNFVTLTGNIYLHRYGRHVDIARGDPVQYAGEVQFSGRTNRGQLRRWNNQSGHYQPAKGDAIQAGLPIDKFMVFD